ncbi:MAG TPA: L-histidine N(alpha)-methyltransferase [Kofleriaceae bacterium]|nr:L-histidine N(alpha)-methyltransferase [Kofleriaceae bacterium]
MSVVARARVPEDDVIAGLQSSPKRLPCRLLYDEHGAELFDRITGLDEYYPTRTELRLLDAHLPAIAADVGVAARVIEPGSGIGIKTKRLLRALDRPAIYIGIDVAAEALEYGAKVLRAEHRELEVHTIVGDFLRPFTLPAPKRPFGKTLVFFPGSTIGNFEPFAAVSFLGGLQQIAGPNARLLLGADGTRDPHALLPAYDDVEGVTSEFDMNVLTHLNRTRGATFDLTTFKHRAVWNERQSRVEMHLVSLCDQRVQIGEEQFTFAAGEPIVTEYSYKHSLSAMRGILLAAGWQVCHAFTSPERPMRLWLCEPRNR